MHRSQISESAHGQGPSERILLVEDDPDVRYSVTLVLQNEGYDVATAGDGREALEVLRRAAPALILLDLMMPVMDGFEFRVRQMQDPELARIPVIIFSGGSDLERKAATLHAAACLGWIPIESEPGKGSRFSVYFPSAVYQ
jgi:CheY-like chemotaxis protein